MTDRKIGVMSMVMLFLNLTLAKYLLVVPSFMVGRVGNSAWIVVLIKGVLALALFAVTVTMYKPFAELGLGDVSKQAFGKTLGGVVSVLIAAVMVIRSSFLLRTLAEAMRTLEAENATIEYMALFILLPVLICALKGVNANVNISILILPFTLASIAAIGFALIPHYNVNNITPILGEGIVPILRQSFLEVGGMFEIIYIFTLSKYLAGYSQLRKSGLIGIGAVSAAAVLFSVMYGLSIPYPASKNFFFPLYQLTRLIKSGSFLQRMEPIVIFIWAGIVLCSLTTAALGACELLKSAACRSDVSGILPILLIIMFLIGVIPQSELETYKLYKSALNFSHFFYIIALFVILIIARLRRAGKSMEVYQ